MVRFYTVDVGNPWSFFVSGPVTASSHDRAALAAEAETWCAAHFKTGTWRRLSAIEIAVYDQRDAMEFKLRWC